MPIAPLLRTFARFEDLEPARAELLASGLPASAVQLRMLGDEAGPVEGNFVSGNGVTARGEVAPGGVLTGGKIPYAENFASVPARGVHLMIVEAVDETQRRQAASILDRYDAVDVGATGNRRRLKQVRTGPPCSPVLPRRLGARTVRPLAVAAPGRRAPLGGPEASLLSKAEP